MTNYMLENYNVEFNKIEKKIIFRDKNRKIVLTIDKMTEILLLGKLIVSFYADIQFEDGIP